MKRLICGALILSALTATSISAEEWELKDRPTLTFKESLIDDLVYYEVKLKPVKMWRNYSKTSEAMTMSYIVTLYYPLSESGGTIDISLLDKQGFEITKKSLSRVVKNYKGDLKGNFTVTPNEFQKIAGAELNFMLDMK